MVDTLTAGLGLAPALALVVASFFASALTAAFGIGGGVAMLALLGYALPIQALIPVHGLVQLGSNAGRAVTLRAHVRRDVLTPFALGAAVGAAVGAMTVVRLPEALLRTVLALFVLAITWAKPPSAGRLSAGGLAAGGLLTTLATMFVGATGPLVAALFARTLTDRKQLVGTTAVAMSVQHFVKVVAFGFLGFAFSRFAPLVIAMIASGYLGTLSGARLLAAIPEKAFRLAFRLLLTALALDLLRRGVTGLLVSP
ncbi:MAG TPA: TSUP family transporter [Rhizobiaceae bacterium]|nr:TSUP family transporter [Rhizobiaceae bacterium]